MTKQDFNWWSQLVILQFLQRNLRWSRIVKHAAKTIFVKSVLWKGLHSICSTSTHPLPGCNSADSDIPHFNVISNALPVIQLAQEAANRVHHNPLVLSIAGSLRTDTDTRRQLGCSGANCEMRAISTCRTWAGSADDENKLTLHLDTTKLPPKPYR